MLSDVTQRLREAVQRTITLCALGGVAIGAAACDANDPSEQQDGTGDALADGGPDDALADGDPEDTHPIEDSDLSGPPPDADQDGTGADVACDDALSDGVVDYLATGNHRDLEPGVLNPSRPFDLIVRRVTGCPDGNTYSELLIDHGWCREGDVLQSPEACGALAGSVWPPTPACAAAGGDIEEYILWRAGAFEVIEGVSDLREALLAVLGEVDTAHEAALLALDAHVPTWTGPFEYPESGLDRGFWPSAVEVTSSQALWVVKIAELAWRDGCEAASGEAFGRYQVGLGGDVSTLELGYEPYAEACIPENTTICDAGRRPEGWAGPRAVAASSALGRYFGVMEQLEAAAVVAFEALANALDALGAPAALSARAREAAADEVRHAAEVGAMARRFGARLAPGEASPPPPAGLEAFALENVVEGCVRETFAVAQALYQAEHARDPEVAALMARVADDEARHAQLSWDVLAWCVTRLDAHARPRLDQAMRDEVEALRQRARHSAASAALRDVAGVPCAATMGRLIDAVDHDLWTPALAA